MRKWSWASLASVLLVGVVACNADSNTGACGGDVGCPCEHDGDCLNGLSCLSALCIDAGDGASSAGGMDTGSSGEASSAGGSSAGTGGVSSGTGGGSAASAGSGATAGESTSAGGTMGSDAGSGGTTSSGGVMGSGGTTGSGGSGAAGGTLGSGGSGAAGGTLGSGGSGAAGGTMGSGGSTSTGGSGGAGGSGGSPTSAGASCEGLSSACQGESCCTTLRVPSQTFSMGGTQYVPTSQATVSAFYLDKYEVTVGRFRNFVEGFEAWRAAGNPEVGAGMHPVAANTGWRSDWDGALASSVAELNGTSGLACSASYQTWTASAGANEQLPLNCVDWFEAFAFCIWDGGRLPSEAEWESAAAGGSEERYYPWSDPASSTSIDTTVANWDCRGDGSASMVCAFTDILEVGSKPDGAARWGHLDMGGSVSEWVFDNEVDLETDYPATCNDCVKLSGDYRVVRNSGWNASISSYVRSTYRGISNDEYRTFGLGFRCARD